MKVYDKIKSMNQNEFAQFISDLLCGNPNETADGFWHYLCCDCEAAGYVSYGEIYDCDYSSGNCSDVDRVKEWLESEVTENV